MSGSPARAMDLRGLFSVGIRAATLADVPRLVAMGAQFLGSSSYAATLADSPDQMARVASFLIADARGLLVVSTAAGRVTGMLGMMIFPHFLSGELVAGELFWWVEPEARGAGLRLLRHAEAWAAAGRLLLFPAPCFHSRAILENYGTAGDDARLIQLVFGTGSLEPAEGAVCV